MTEEQMTLIKTLIKKHGISATDGEWTLVFLGASYGLTEKQIDSYLIADTSDLLAKHEKMLCILFGIEPESNGEIQRMENPAATGKLEHFTRDGINDKILELGAKPGSSVTKKTDYLICGEKAGSKLAKAQSLGIPILTEAEFLEMIA